MVSMRFTRPAAVGAFVLAGLALVLFVASVFSHGMGRTGTLRLAPMCGMRGGCQGVGMMAGQAGSAPAAFSRATEDVSTVLPASGDAFGAPSPLLKMMPPEPVNATVVGAERKIAATASLNLRSKDLNETLDKIRAIAKNTGGFVENATVDQPENGQKSAWVTVKVPADRLDVALAEMKQSAAQVVNESMGAVDVTAENIDLAARLKNKKAEEAAYEALLSSATKVSDVIEVTQQLTQVRSEVESLEQQMRYLEGQTSLSSVTISITEDPQVQAQPGEFKRGNIFKSAINTLLDALLALGSGLVYFLISGLPILLLILGVLWVVYRIAKRSVDHLFGR